MPRPVQRNAAVTPGVRPMLGSKPKVPVMLGWQVLLDSTLPHDQVEVDAGQAQFVMTASTFAWVSKSPQAMQLLGNEKAESVRQMKVTMVKVGQHNPTRPATPAKKPVLQVETAMERLNRELTGLVQDMAANQSPTADQQRIFAGRYGKLRDQMAKHRQAFLQAEGQFELAQALLVQQMGLD